MRPIWAIGTKSGQMCSRIGRRKNSIMKGSNVHEVNFWLWQFWRGKPSLGGLSMADKEDCQTELQAGCHRCPVETRKGSTARKAGKWPDIQQNSLRVTKICHHDVYPILLISTKMNHCPLELVLTKIRISQAPMLCQKTNLGYDLLPVQTRYGISKKTKKVEQVCIGISMM